MLSTTMNEALNQQINEEMFSSYLYLSMSGWFESKGLSGFANWMRVQTKEETFHAEKIIDFINERGGRLSLQTIAQPDGEWDTPLAAFEAALAHEEHISSCINELVDTALSEKDHASNNFLQWFVAEQVEEEANVGTVVDKLRLIKEDTTGLFALDLELAKRVYVEAATE